jgi:hypothetical protein
MDSGLTATKETQRQAQGGSSIDGVPDLLVDPDAALGAVELAHEGVRSGFGHAFDAVGAVLECIGDCLADLLS